MWGRFAREDNESAARAASLRFGASSSHHFYTSSTRLAHELSWALHMPWDRMAWAVYLIYDAGTVWNKIVPSPAYWQHQLEQLRGEPFNIPAFEREIEKALQKLR